MSANHTTYKSEDLLSWFNFFRVAAEILRLWNFAKVLFHTSQNIMAKFVTFREMNVAKFRTISRNIVLRNSNVKSSLLKGSVQRKLRPRLLYIIQKLFSWRWAAENKIFTFLNGQFAIYIKPLQRICPSPITFAGKCYSPSANCVCGQ